MCVCACEFACVCFPSVVGVWSRAWPISETMSELEQLRQEAEQLRNQIRVRRHAVCAFFVYIVVVVFVCVHTSHVRLCVFTACSDTVTCVTFVRPSLE